MTALAAEIAELAEMLAAEQPGTLPGWTEEEDGDGRRWRTALADGRTAVIERLDDDRSFLPKVHESAGEYEAGPVAYSAAAAAAWCVQLAAEPEPAKAHVPARLRLWRRHPRPLHAWHRLELRQPRRHHHRGAGRARERDGPGLTDGDPPPRPDRCPLLPGRPVRVRAPA
jgi:hypothetical protein